MIFRHDFETSENFLNLRWTEASLTLVYFAVGNETTSFLTYMIYTCVACTHIYFNHKINRHFSVMKFLKPGHSEFDWKNGRNTIKNYLKIQRVQQTANIHQADLQTYATPFTFIRHQNYNERQTNSWQKAPINSERVWDFVGGLWRLFLVEKRRFNLLQGKEIVVFRLVHEFSIILCELILLSRQICLFAKNDAQISREHKLSLCVRHIFQRQFFFFVVISVVQSIH